jgi:preprotein translocase subunit SecA
LQQAQQQAAAILLSQSWSDYLEWVDQLLDHVSLMRTGPNDPYTTFNRQIIEAYEHLLDTLEADLLDLCLNLQVEGGKINLAAAGLRTPPSTRTYLIDDGSDTLEQASGVSMLVAAAMNPGLALLALAARKWKQREVQR